MKNIISILILLLTIYSCSSTQNTNTSSSIKNPKEVVNDTIRIANDSLEYEIIIIEPGFQSWLVSQRPRGYYGLSYLEIRNRIYVTNYNIRVNQPQQYNPSIYQQRINYNPQTKYGYEVNYLLYNYFVYFEQRYKQRLR